MNGKQLCYPIQRYPVKIVTVYANDTVTILNTYRHYCDSFIICSL